MLILDENIIYQENKNALMMEIKGKLADSKEAKHMKIPSLSKTK